MNKTRWNATTILNALASVPAPLISAGSADAFRNTLASLQNAPNARAIRLIAKPASAEIIRIIRSTANTKHAQDFEDELLFGLKVLGYTCTPEAADFTVELAQRGLGTDHFLWSVALSVYGDGHPQASRLFRAFAKKLPPGFIGISLLDAANTAAREHDLKPHPFDSAEGAKRLRELLSDTSGKHDSYAISACAAIPFLSAARRKSLISLARKHKDPSIRLEVAWAMGMLKDKQSIQYLVDQCLDRDMSIQAQQYLKEIKQKKLIPKPATEPDFAAMAEMCNWLKHPNEYGEPPDTIELMDKRTIFWPPLNKKREMRLFSFVYNKSKHRPKRDVGVGLVGSTTWSFFSTTKPSMKPEDIYGIHCCWELECNDDTRTPKKLAGKSGWNAKAGWALIAAGPNANTSTKPRQRTKVRKTAKK